jgi:hypothetical protein
MEKDLIIGAFKNYSFETIKPWVQSINDCGFKGEKVIISIGSSKETNAKLADAGFTVIDAPSQAKMGFHMERFIHIYNFLKENGDKYRYVITTDVRDVIFQKNPSEWLEMNMDSWAKLVAISESIKIKNEHWNRQNIINAFGQYFYNDVAEQDVYNVGTLAGDSEYVRDLCGMLYQLSANRPDWVADQAAYNILLNWRPYVGVTQFVGLSDAWSCNLHITNKPDEKEHFAPFIIEPVPYFEDGLVKDGTTKEPFYIVHQYDRDPELMSFFKKKYKVEDVITFRTDV